MKKKEQALVILEALDKYVQINWNMEDIYIKAISEGLKEIAKLEKGDDE